MAEGIPPKKILYVTCGENIDPALAGLMLPHLANAYPEFLIQFNLEIKFSARNGHGKDVLAVIVEDEEEGLVDDNCEMIIVDVNEALLSEPDFGELETMH
jgi:hypothetical protein